MKRFGLGPAFLAAAILNAPGAAGAGGLDQFVGFGDSTMDSGYFLYNSTGGRQTGQSATAVDVAIHAAAAAGASGSFTGPGIMNTTLLAARFGLTALPAYPGGGTNYANGSAQTVLTTQQSQYSSGFFNNVPTVGQISNYLARAGNVANPHALYMISTGANDLFWMQTQTAVPNATPDQLYQTFMAPWAKSLAAQVGILQAGGARTILVLDLNEYARLVGPDGVLPSAADRTFVAEARTYSAAIWSSLAAAGVNFVPVDISSLFATVAQHPAAFGFTAPSVLGSNPACNLALAPTSILCTPADLVAPDAEQTHLWVDGVHLTTAGQIIEVDYIYSLLTAPSQISLLAEGAVQSDLARAATIQGQIDLSEQHRGPTGINAWVSAGAGSLRVRNATGFPTDSGTPFGGTVGADYRTPGGAILGVAVTAGDQTQGFSTGGQFEQADQAVSLYAAYRAGPLWGDAVASYDLLQDHTARQVRLGSFTDQNNGDTNGHDLALALRGGWDCRLGPITTGPTAGAVLQQVRLDGFGETGGSGVTALSFGGQTRNSAVSQLGWRGAVDVGKWQPFADMDWIHEWAGRNRSITAALLSLAAPSYTAAAAPVARDGASASLGVVYRLSPQVTLRGALAAEFFVPQATSYGGELGLNVSF
jgi:outer membrane lipase/esterase